MKLGIGIIGCGGISRKHVESCISLSEQCEIKGVADIDYAKAVDKAKELGGKAIAFDDYRNMLARDDIDVVAICTPPFAHQEPAVAALRAGKHVLVEKPLGASLQECDDMIAAAQAAGRQLAGVFQLRFNEEIMRIRHLLRTKEMGPVVWAQMNGYYWRGANYYNVPWRGKFHTECGGVTMNHSIHTLDLFLWLLDAEPVSVWAYMGTTSHNVEVEDWSVAVIRFANGAVGQVNCTLNAVKEAHTMSFSSHDRYVAYPFELHAVKEGATGFPTTDVEAIDRLRQLSLQAPPGEEPKHRSIYADLFRAIRENRAPLVTGTQARRTLEVITAIYKSASTGQEVALPLAQDDPWYTRQGILEHVKRSEVDTGKEGIRS